jgi:hypothetical protein
MPLTLTLTEGVLPKGAEKTAFAELAASMLRLHGLEGNTFMTPNVVGSIHVISPEHTFSGLHEAPVAFVELKVPSFAFTDRRVQKAYVAEATDILQKISEGKLLKEQIWVNVTHAVDGAWGIAGEALSNSELVTAISNG